jgi:hypothetical protein
MKNPTEQTDNIDSILLDDHIAQVKANLEHQARQFAPDQDWLPSLTIQKHPNAKAFTVAFDPRYVSNTHNKDRVAAHIAHLIANTKPYIATFSACAWLKGVEPKRDPATAAKVRPEELRFWQFPGKKEIVWINSRTSTGETRLVFGDVVRSPNAHPKIAWHCFDSSYEHDGRFPDAMKAGFAKAGNSPNQKTSVVQQVAGRLDNLIIDIPFAFDPASLATKKGQLEQKLYILIRAIKMLRELRNAASDNHIRQLLGEQVMAAAIAGNALANDTEGNAADLERSAAELLDRDQGELGNDLPEPLDKSVLSRAAEVITLMDKVISALLKSSYDEEERSDYV